MNMTNMVLQQSSQPAIKTSAGNKTGKTTAGSDMAFQSLLVKADPSLSNILGEAGASQGKDQKTLLSILMGLAQKEMEGSEIKPSEAIDRTAQELIGKLIEKSSDLSGEATDVSISQIFPGMVSPDKAIGVKTEELIKQLEAILSKAETVLAKLTDQASISKAAPAVLSLLEQWTALDKSNRIASPMVLEQTKNTSKEMTSWKELVQAFQKRNQFAAKQQYNADAKVTTSDVVKWLQHAVRNQQQLDRTVVQPQVSINSAAPMSKVEQFIIHMNTNTNSAPAENQLIEQFQKVIKTSRFLSATNGTSQLSITLRPENLGEMMVKLTQINGEMTVKIMVTSQAAKEMLESNMHQLKNMFTPQQVVVEKQELSAQQAGQAYQKEHDQQSAGENPNDESEHSHQQSDQSDENDFQSQFEEALNENLEVIT
ncbi:flagellar hook-length control protein FliK [Virgibacillus kekensis]|uniref:Flagellar hook-length control protein FliK n=1 Tax=Virgibacillus kekensis TaxID=202261 RepID=A0ABV9DH36_9BACI